MTIAFSYGEVTSGSRQYWLATGMMLVVVGALLRRPLVYSVTMAGGEMRSVPVAGEETRPPLVMPLVAHLYSPLVFVAAVSRSFGFKILFT